MTLISDSLREAVAQRAANRCEYCRLAQESQVATFPVDHIIPVSLNGPTELVNLALTCTRCNALKWIRVKDTSAPICACFGFRVEDIEADVRQGTPTRIRELLAKSKSSDAQCHRLAADGRLRR